MTIVMKRKQSTGKERKRKERKDKNNNNNKDKKDTVSKSKSTTQKKRRRFTKKQKKAKLMKNRSIRKQIGGNPTVTEMLENKKKKAIRKAKRYGKPNEDDLSDLDDVLEKQTPEDKKEIAKQSARDTVSMLKIPLTIKETKQLRRLVFFNIYTQHNTQRKKKYEVLQYIYNEITKINYDSEEKINFVINELLKTNIFSGAMNKDSPDEKIERFYVDVSNQVIDIIDINNVLLKKTRERISKMKENDNNKFGYDLIKQKVNIINSLINKRNKINIKEKKQPKQREHKLSEELSNVKSKEIVTRELARLEASKQAERAEAEARKAAEEAEEARKAAEAEAAKKIEAVSAAKKAAKDLKKLTEARLKAKEEEAKELQQYTDELLNSIKGKLDEINNNYMNEKFLENDIKGEDGILNTLRKNYETINDLYKSINELNSSIIEVNKEVPVSIKGILETATKTLETATTKANKLKEIIQVLQIIDNNFDIINGNTPDTPNEEKLSKITEQQYIVIPDPSNNMKSIDFCEEKEGEGIPAEARDYEFFIIFLDGYDKKTKVQYDGKTIDNIQEERYPIKDCDSGDA